MKRVCQTAAMIVAGATSLTSADIVSTFDAGLEGWTSPNASGLTWQSTGGNPGGYVRFQDLGPANGGQLVAPAAFLGDWSAYNGAGSIGGDFRVFAFGAAPFNFPNIRITGSAGTAIFNGTVPTGPTDWFALDVALSASSWDVQTGTWSDILADVTELRVFLPAASTGSEITGVDNIRLIVPAPASMALVGLGGLFAARRRRRVRSHHLTT